MNHNFFKLNPDNNLKTKKIFIILFRKAYGEIDWILPLVNRFNKNYLFFGIIENKNELDMLKKNLFLKDQFEKNFHGYFIENKFKNFFLRILSKIFKVFNLPLKSKILERFKNNYFSYNNLTSIISKDYDLKNLEKINIFLTYDKLYNSWEEELSKQKNSTTYYFPSSCSIKPEEKPSIDKDQVKDKNKFLILSNDLSLIYWKNTYPKLKQMIIGYPRYNKIWMENIKQKLNKSESIRIYLSYRRDLMVKEWFDKAIMQLNTIKSILKRIDKNFEIYVKIHPYSNQSELSNYLINEQNIKFIFTRLHQQEICKISNFSINFFRSASILESLSTRTPAIELFKLANEIPGSPYKDQNISFYAEDQHVLENYIKKFCINDKEIYEEFQKKYKNFESVCLRKDPIDLFEEFLNLKRNNYIGFEI